MLSNHNVTVVKTLNQLQKRNKASANVMEKLSTGKRVNRAADDSAGLSISQKMKAQIRGLEQAKRNIQDGTSMIQEAENGLGTIHNPNLMRLRELVVHAANGTLTSEDRKHIQNEIEQIKQGIDDIANNTKYRDVNLLNVPDKNLKLQVGANKDNTFDVVLADVRTMAIGVDEIVIDPLEKAQEAIGKIDQAISKVSGERSKFGAYHNALERTYNAASNASLNLTEAKSRIVDMDMAKGVLELTKNNILSQSTQAMLAQANQRAQGVMELLRS